MSRTIRNSCYAIALSLFSLWTFTSAIAQTVTYKDGFCLGVAGLPPANYITPAFDLGPTSGDLRAEFMRGLGEKYGGNVRRDATGCRMFPTASEAEEARRQLLEQSRTMSTRIVEIDWVPTGATPLPAAAPASGANAIRPESPGVSAPQDVSDGRVEVLAIIPKSETSAWLNQFGKPR